MRQGGPRLRANASVLCAVALVVASAVIGAPSASAAPTAQVPLGGCWRYIAASGDLAAQPSTDLSTSLEPWSSGGSTTAAITLGTTGATASAKQRSISVEIDNGPVVSAADATGVKASFVVSVDGQELASPIVTTFDAGANQAVDVAATGNFANAGAGTHSVQLDAVYFDVPAQTTPAADAYRIACNGQTEGEPTASGTPGVNPATTPEPTGVTATYDSVAAPAVTVTRVRGQRVLDSARAGDVVTIAATGFASAADLAIEFCRSTTCTPAVGTWTSGDDGSGAFAVTVPDGVEAGRGRIRVSDGDTTTDPGDHVSATTPMRVLGTPAITTTEKVRKHDTVVKVKGTGWDPGKRVRVRGLTGTDGDSAATSDKRAGATAKAHGRFHVRFTVTDTATASIRAVQAHAGTRLTAVADFSGTVGTTGTDTTDTGSTDTTDTTGTTSTTGTTTTETPTTAPSTDIPLPGDVPVKDTGTTPVTPVTPEQQETLTVSEVHIVGHAGFGELFGAAPRRKLLFVVKNAGTAAVTNPIVRIAIGRSQDIEPEAVSVPIGTLQPGDETVATVPIELPMAAFGHYHVIGKVGDAAAGRFTVAWTTYPWGLFVLNAFALALLVLGIRHRVLSGRPAPYRPAPAAAGADDAVVDLSAAEAWWNHRVGARLEPLTAPMVPGAPADDDGEAVVDLAAAEAWWARRSGGSPTKAS